MAFQKDHKTNNLLDISLKPFANVLIIYEGSHGEIQVKVDLASIIETSK